MKILPNLKFEFSLPSETDADIGASNGLADIQEYYDLDPMLLIKGLVKNDITGRVTRWKLLKIAKNIENSHKNFNSQKYLIPEIATFGHSDNRRNILCQIKFDIKWGIENRKGCKKCKLPW